jgi:hypothetical protein
MNPNAPQGIARSLITEADHLSRLAHRDGNEGLSALFAAIRTEIAHIERRCGANPPRRIGNVEIDLAQTHVHTAVMAAEGYEPKILLDRLKLLADRLRPPRALTLVGLLGGRD